MSSEFIDILLFGVIAVFLIYRLRSILGSTDGKIVNIKTKKSKSSFKPKIVPQNTNTEFLDGANKAYEMIVQA
jgi:predicted lipid-binding transport protein (Tim44 family)